MKKIGMWLGHYEVVLFAAMIMVSVVPDRLFTPGWLGPAIVGTLAIAAIFGTTVHEFQLCERCAARIKAPFPQITGEAVQRRRHALRLHHASRQRLLASVALFAALMFLPKVLAPVILAVIMVLLLFGIVAQRIHGRLMPWCPYCNDDDGWDDDDEHAPEPQPTTAGQR